MRFNYISTRYTTNYTNKENSQTDKERFKNVNDCIFISSNLELTISKSIDSLINSELMSLAWLTSLFSRLNILSNDVNLAFPRLSLPIEIKGLLNMIENTVPWKESVITKSAS